MRVPACISLACPLSRDAPRETARSFFFVDAALCPCSRPSLPQDGYEYIVTSLRSFQAADGAFAPREGAQSGDVDSSARASVLAALYGLSNRVGVSAVVQSVNEAEKSDGGFAETADGPSTARGTFLAAVTLKNFDANVNDAAKTATFLRSLFDESSGLFAPSVGGGKGDITSTRYALAALDTIGQLKSATSLFPSIRDYLTRFLRGGDHFEFPGDALAGSRTYEGILVGALVDFDFANYEHGMVARFERLAGPQGIAASETGLPTLETTAHAASAGMSGGGAQALARLTAL